MAKIFLNKYRIDSARTTWWDYSSSGAYFVTICTHDRSHAFGEIIGDKMNLSKVGEFSQKCWNEIPKHIPKVELGAFQVMPNHIHGIIIIHDSDFVETMHASSLREPDPDFMSSISPKSGSLARIVGSYKSAVSKSAHDIDPLFKWQERFWDRIIRDEYEYDRTQK